METLFDAFRLVGLTEIEARIYFSVLENDALTPTQMARKMGVGRTTLYPHIDNLLQRGYLGKTLHKKRILYRAESPQNILNDFEKGQSMFQRSLPLLLELFTAKNKDTNLEFYNGAGGVRDLYRKVFSQTTHIDAFFSFGEFLKYFSMDFDDELRALTNKHGSTIKNLANNDDFGRQHQQITSGVTRLLPEGFELFIDLLVHGDHVAIISFSSLYGVYLKNRDIADFMREVHKYFWMNASSS